MTRWGSTLILAAAYYLAAKLGLALAIPPGYATAVWPAAGIALAGALLRPAAWPGVILGSFLANLPTAAAGEPASLLRSGLIPLSLGLGAAAQALLGASLIRRYVGFPNPLTDPRAVGLFFLLGGPLACLLSSTWALTTLLAAGVVPWPEAGFNWWTWWVGDVIGCLTMAPLILVWASPANAGSLRRPLAVCLPLGIVFASIVVLFLYTSTWERARLQSDFERRADGIAGRVTSQVEAYLEVLHSLTNLYASTSVMNSRVFHDFSRHPLSRHAGIEALSWNVGVAHAGRAAFEQSLRDEGYAAFEIVETDAEGRLVPAARRPGYVAVTYIEPRASNAQVLGYDVASEPARLETLERARKTGLPAATGRVRLVQEGGDQYGLLVFAPAPAPPRATAGGHREAYAVGVFRFHNMLDAALSGLDTEGLRTELRDETAPPSERVLYRMGSAGSPGAPVFERRVDVAMAGRHWAIVFRLAPEYLAAHRPWQAWSVLAAGLLFGGLLGAFLLVVTGRTSEVEQLVLQRTRELAAANEHLAAEARERGRAQRELERVMGSVSDTLWAAEVRPDGSHGSPYWSPNVEALTGRPAAAFGQDPDGWLAIVCEEDRPLVRAMRGRLAAGLAEHEQAEYRVVLPDGRERWLRDSVSASRGPGGGVQLSGVLSDITAARETERLSRERDTQAAAAKRDERFRSLIENASDVVVVLDEAGAVLYASPSVETVLGFRADAVVGHAAFDAVLPEDRGELLRGLEAVAARPGSAAPLRARIRDPRGVVRVIEGTARNLSHKPEVGGIVVNGRDVTERDQLEVQLRQAQKMDAVGQLAGGVAHDFNNLLGVINGYGDLLLREVPPDHPWVARVLQIKKAADRAGDLTRQLLAFSRKQVQRLQLLDLNTMVGSVAQMLARLIGEDVRVTTVLSPRIGRVRADPTQIEQVVMNLALNARDAMPLGGTLTIETGEVDLDDAFLEGHAGASPGRHVALTVSDTGHGMDEQTQARIFEPFFTTKTEGRGTGLGLATVYGIVKQSHGYITVSSAPGRGTTFRVYLPRAADAAAAGAQPAAAPMPLPRGSETVLLVEDDPQLRSLLREILSGAGYRVLEAAQPEDAIAASSAHPGALDVLLTDVIMPTMSGREVADAVCAARPAVKVLYMSGYTNDVLGRHHALDPGIDLLEKPFSAYSVLSRLRAVLDA